MGPIVFAGPIFWPMEKAPVLLRFYRDWSAEAPDELMTIVVQRKAPPLPFGALIAQEATSIQAVLGLVAAGLGARALASLISACGVARIRPVAVDRRILGRSPRLHQLVAQELAGARRLNGRC